MKLLEIRNNNETLYTIFLKYFQIKSFKYKKRKDENNKEKRVNVIQNLWKY